MSKILFSGSKEGMYWKVLVLLVIRYVFVHHHIQVLFTGINQWKMTPAQGKGGRLRSLVLETFTYVWNGCKIRFYSSFLLILLTVKQEVPGWDSSKHRVFSHLCGKRGGGIVGCKLNRDCHTVFNGDAVALQQKNRKSSLLFYRISLALLLIATITQNFVNVQIHHFTDDEWSY